MRHAYELPNRMDVPGDHPCARHGGDPVLRSACETTSSGTPTMVYAYGGVHYIRGNHAPYFSLTFGAVDRGGCCDEEILQRWPELAPLATLHLSDWYGVPMHAEANGFYQLAGYAGGLGERFHAGNADDYGRHEPETNQDRRERCLWQWASHMRLRRDVARTCADAMIEEGKDMARRTGYEVAPGVFHAEKAEGMAVRKLHAAFVDAQRERWQQEADACVAALGIRYYYGERVPAEKLGGAA